MLYEQSHFTLVIRGLQIDMARDQVSTATPRIVFQSFVDLSAEFEN